MEQSLGYIQNHVLNLTENEVERDRFLDRERQMCFARIIFVVTGWEFSESDLSEKSGFYMMTFKQRLSPL